MPEQDHSIQQEMDEKTSKPMEWQQVLFLQVNRINDAMTRGDGNFMAGIEALEMDLAFFSENDKAFKNDIKDIDVEATKWLVKQKQVGGYVPNEDQAAAAYARSKLLMKALLRMIGRAGFYPESQSSYEGKV